jgi:hypothetical protein
LEDVQMIEIAPALSLSISATLAGVALCLYANLPIYSRLWVPYPILDGWLMSQYTKEARAKSRALLTGFLFLGAGLIGMFSSL